MYLVMITTHEAMRDFRHLIVRYSFCTKYDDKPDSGK